MTVIKGSIDLVLIVLG